MPFQVSLIAVNVLGSEIVARRHSNPENAEKFTDLVNDPEYWSPYDDLAFEMYVDTDVAKIIREMETKKRLAVISERFEFARKLKLAMESLRSAGEKLGKYELEKRHAIELEDYERARHKKNQMDDYRVGVYQELCVEQLLESEGVSTNMCRLQRRFDLNCSTAPKTTSASTRLTPVARTPSLPLC